MAIVPALGAPTAALAASGMQYQSPQVTCDTFLHQLTIVSWAGAANLSATTPQPIHFRLWIYNNTTRRYPLQALADGSTAWITMYHVPTSTIQSSGYTFTESTTVRSGEMTYTVPKGNYSVWVQYAWPSGSSFVYSPTVQAQLFRPTYSQFGQVSYFPAKSCDV